ncbi:MAG TPA: hypothetical protein DCY20_00255, partial [Firmicutes bacterium]|nr:hypothetical protein [Bacillota bacterium]
MFKKLSVLMCSVFLLMGVQMVDAATVKNSTILYDGYLKVELTIDAPYWSSKAGYTGYNPYNLYRISVESNVPGSGYWITDAYNNYQVTDGGSRATATKGGFARAY